MTYLNEYLLKEQIHLKIYVFRCQNGNGESVSLKPYKRKKFTEIVMVSSMTQIKYSLERNISKLFKCISLNWLCQYTIPVIQKMKECPIRLKYINISYSNETVCLKESFRPQSVTILLCIFVHVIKHLSVSISTSLKREYDTTSLSSSSFPVLKSNEFNEITPA